MEPKRLGELLALHTEAWNSHDLERLMGLFADDCVFEASGGDEVCGQRFSGREDVRAAFGAVLRDVADARWGDGRHHVLGPDYGVSEWTLTGTRGDGSKIEVNGCDFLTYRGEEIVRKNSYRKQRAVSPPTDQ